MKRVAIYARFSSDLQSDMSIDDQLRICRKKAEGDGWQIVTTYEDRAFTSANMMRPGLQALLEDARAGRFEVVLAESLDRISRDQADLPLIYKQLNYLDISIITLSEGPIGPLQIGVGSIVGSMFMSELARKTRRGLEGRVLAGKSAGGKAYGYDSVKRIDADGNVVAGDRRINEAEAAIVQRIFRDYAKGKSPKKIAYELNKEGIRCPSGESWGPSSIYGNRRRGTGIINNELYIGRLVWNKQRYVRNPATGKRVAKPNPEDQWVISDVPELRIIDQALWDAVKAYQGKLDAKPNYYDKQRPPKLLSYLLKCGVCGGGLSIMAQGRYGCSTARNKGTCDCRLTIRQEVLEEKVLSTLRTRLMDPKLTNIFCDEYVKEINRLRMDANSSRELMNRELEKTEKSIKKLLEAIMDGVDPKLVKDELNGLSSKKDELTMQLQAKPEAPAYIHPKMGERYATAVSELIESLNDPNHRTESATILRQLIEKIVLTPNEDGSALVVDLYGDLAGILQIADNNRQGIKLKPRNELNRKQSSEIEQVENLAKVSETLGGQGFKPRQAKMVAGAGFEPATFRL